MSGGVKSPGYLRRHWRSRAMQPVIYLPDGTPTQEEFDRDSATRPVIVGTLLWAAYPKGEGQREYVLDCRHGTTSLLLNRDSAEDDPFVLAQLVEKHQHGCNQDPKGTEWCACEPRRSTRVAN